MRRLIWFLCLLICCQHALAEDFFEKVELDLPENVILANPWEDELPEKILEANFSPSQNEEESAAIRILEAHPSSIVYNCVNAVTGDFFESQVDLVVHGSIPLVVQRTYSSADRKWHFQHMPELEVGQSSHGRHLIAAYQDDTGSGMLYQARRSEIEFEIPESVYKNGLTNCGSEEISGQTNWKNSSLRYVRLDDEKMYLLCHGSHVNRLFSPYKKSARHKNGPSFGKFHLYREFHPTGNYLQYFYEDKDSLSQIKAFNNKGKLLGELTRSEEGCKWHSNCGEVNYRFNKKNLISSTNPSNAIPVSYDYSSDYLALKILPNGRFLKIDYYTSGKNKGRVSQLCAPVSNNKTDVPIYTFVYDKGETKVQDAHKLLTTYSFDPDNKKLNKITKFNKQGQILTTDTFLWASSDCDDKGNLISRQFQEKDKILFRRVLQYDRFGNIASDNLYGNLTGKNPFQEEVYTRHYRSSQEGRNLPKEENDGRKRIRCHYYPQTNLLKLRLTETDKILKREYFEYDENGVLTLEIVDDGISEDIKNLTGISERHVKEITPNLDPTGLPFKINEYFYDLVAKTYCLLKKTAYFYYPNGKLKEQWNYGIDPKISYKLSWEYDSLGNVTKYKDALGQVTEYQYDANGNKKFEKGPRQDVFKKFEYDLANRLIQEKEVWADGREFVTLHQYNLLNQRVATRDIYGNVTTYKYNDLGYLTEIHLPDTYDLNGQPMTSKTVNHCDAMGNIVVSIDANGHYTKKDYTLRGQPYRIEYPDGSVETKEYTIDGLLEKEIAKNGTSTTYIHDALGHMIRTEIRDKQNNLLKQTSATYGTFQLLSEIDENGLSTSYEYDGAGRKICMTKGDHKIYYEYDNFGNESKICEEGIDEIKRCTIRKYDYLGRLEKESIEDNLANIFSEEENKYDETGNRTHHILSTQAGHAITVTEFTPHGRPKTVIDALGHTTHITYNYSYPYQGTNILQEMKIDPLGNREETLYNAHGKVHRINRYNSLDFLTQSETYEYDPKDQRTSSKVIVLASQSPREVITKWEYDALGNAVTCIEAKGTPEQKTTHTIYNLFGQKEKIIKPDGITLFYEYDPLNRLIDLHSSDNSIHYTYDYDLKDHPIKVADLIHHQQILRSYDEYDCLSSETLGAGCTLFYTYDPLNRPLTVTLPDHSQIYYRYDAHYLRTVDRVKNNTLVYRHRYLSYDLAENPLEEELIGKAGLLRRRHDLLQRVIHLATPTWEESIPADGFDAASNLLKRQVKDTKGMVEYLYAYDDLYQLISEIGGCSHIYQNDSAYNRIAKDGQVYSLNALHQLIEKDKRYDSNGNLIQDGDIHYRYDALDRLIEVQNGSHLTTYTYDLDHRRLSKTHNGKLTKYLYQGENEIGAMENETITQLRVLGIGLGAEIGAAVALEFNGIAYAPIQDPHGNLVAILDTSGKVVEGYRYSAFGEPELLTSEFLGNPWRYSGKRYDPETGFIYFGKRYYSPTLGRWLTPDPAGFVDGPNLYAYLHNHPFAYIDPDGQLAWFVLPLAMAALDYCLPAATACLAQYAGGAMAAAFLTGVMQEQ